MHIPAVTRRTCKSDESREAQRVPHPLPVVQRVGSTCRVSSSCNWNGCPTFARIRRVLHIGPHTYAAHHHELRVGKCGEFPPSGNNFAVRLRTNPHLKVHNSSRR